MTTPRLLEFSQDRIDDIDREILEALEIMPPVLEAFKRARNLLSNLDFACRELRRRLEEARARL